jgi:putative acetyltransferase
MSSPSCAISLAAESDRLRLFEVWEASVRATHAFLSEDDIQALIPLVKEELAHFSPIYCLRDSAGQVIAMMGVAGSKMEMLFVHSDHRGTGCGRRLTEFAIEQLGVTEVDVNEQNEKAIGFYERMGFHRVGRSAVDPQGNPFPILHLRLLRPTMIGTDRLRLELQSRDELLAMCEGHPEVSPAWLARLRASTEPDPWTYGFAVVLRASGAKIGDAGFKGPPDETGMVEIAYRIDPEHQGRGYATEAAQGLVAFAFRDHRVRFVWAHTLPTNNASTRVLEKSEFRKVGEVVDPEDGLVWRWERDA